MVVTTSVVPVAPPAPTPAFDTAVVRELLRAAFSDEEFTTLCYDYFRSAHDAFSIGMSRQQKTQILVEHCERQGRMAELLSRVERANPYQYGQFKARLRDGNPASSLKPDPGPKPLPPNPFAGVSSTHFVGREAELRRLRALLQAGSVTLVGEPKIGKSSLLRKLASTWEGPVIGLINCQELEDRDDLYACIAEALGLKDHNWRAIREALKSREVLLLLDELDAAPARGITIDDLSRFRAVAAGNPKFRMVTDSHQPLKTVFPRTGPDSPGYSFLQPLTIELMSEADARLLLSHEWAREAPQFDATTITQLLKLAGCHPFKLQRIAFHRYEALADPSYDWQATYRRDLEQML